MRLYKMFLYIVMVELWKNFTQLFISFCKIDVGTMMAQYWTSIE